MERTPIIVGLQIILSSLLCLLGLSVGTVLGAAGDTPRRGGTLRWSLAIE
jgi:hypothetical protein